MSLEQQAMEEAAGEEDGAADYQPLAPDDGKSFNIGKVKTILITDQICY